MTAPRKPAAFRIEQEPAPKPAAASAPEAAEAPRRPRAVKPAEAVVIPDAVDVFDETDIVAAEPPPAIAPRKRSLLAGIFFGALGVLVSLAVGLWTDQLIRDLFERAPWLGWLAAGMAGLALVALAVILAREFLAIRRLAEVEKMQTRALDAFARNDPKAARALVDELSDFVAAKPQTAAGRKALDDLRGEIMDGTDLLKLAETEILQPLDERAKVLILDAAKRFRWSRPSPARLVDVAYVTFEAAGSSAAVGTLWRQAGTLGFLRLARGVLAHLAVTARSPSATASSADRRARRCGAALGQARRRGGQRHDDGAHRHRGDGDDAPPALRGHQAPRSGDFLSALTAYATGRKREGDASGA